MSEEEVQNWADARALRSRMAFMCGRARVQGFSKSAARHHRVALEGLGSRFNGMGWVSGVRHEISFGNWLCDLQLGMTPELHTEKFEVQVKAAGALLPGINGLHIGIVTALEGDPEGGRTHQGKSAVCGPGRRRHLGARIHAGCGQFPRQLLPSRGGR